MGGEEVGRVVAEGVLKAVKEALEADKKLTGERGGAEGACMVFNYKGFAFGKKGEMGMDQF